jgi:undecaprenyl-diphosphatase
MSGFDLMLFHAVNRFTGRWYALDWAAAAVQDNDLLKGAPFVAAFVWFWFRRSERQGERRTVIVATLPAMLLALVLNRTIAVLMPFRVRPAADPSVLVNPPLPGVTLNFDLENWSSFPSDHATFFFAMVASLWLLSRPAGIVAALYAVAVICVPRVYFGLHYPLDLAVGALLGLATAWAVDIGLRNRLSGWTVRLCERHPEWFYSLMFLAAFETAAMFRNARRLQHGVLVEGVRSLRGILHTAPGTAAAVLLILLVGVGGALAYLYRRSRRGPTLFPNIR